MGVQRGTSPEATWARPKCREPMPSRPQKPEPPANCHKNRGGGRWPESHYTTNCITPSHPHFLHWPKTSKLASLPRKAAFLKRKSSNSGSDGSPRGALATGTMPWTKLHPVRNRGAFCFVSLGHCRQNDGDPLVWRKR